MRDATSTPSETAAPRVRADVRRNRRRIIEAARQVTTFQPYDVTFEAVSEVAELGVATVYRHFPRRVDLLEAVYREDLASLSHLAEELQGGDPWDSLVEWLREFIHFTDAKRAINQELGEAFDQHPELGQLSRDAVSCAVQLVFDPAQEAGLIRNDVTGMDLIQLVGGMHLSIHFTSERDEAILGIILRGIRA